MRILVVVYYFIVFMFGINLAIDDIGRCLSYSEYFKYSDAPYVYRSEAKGQRRVTLIGFFPIHEPGCTRILRTKNYNGLQRAQAMIFGLERIDDMVSKGIRKVAVDGIFYDTCSNDISSMATAVDFVSKTELLSGVVGCSYSSVSIQVSKILQAYNVSMISYASTSTELSDKSQHPLFVRTVPSDKAQAKIVFDLALELKWTSVLLLTTEGSKYSKSLEEAFHNANVNSHRKIHVCSIERLPKNPYFAEEIFQFRTIVRKILQSDVDGIIAFVNADTKKKLIEDLNEDHYYVISGTLNVHVISTDSWDISDKPSIKIANLFAESYVVLPELEESIYTKDLQEYIYSKFRIENSSDVLPESNGNTWMEEFYEDYYGACLGDETCLEIKRNDLKLDTKVEFSLDAVMTYSDAFEEASENLDFNNRSFFPSYIYKSRGRATSKVIFDKCTGNRLMTYAIYRLDKFGKYTRVGWKSLDDNHSIFNDVDPRTVSKLQCRPLCSLDKGEYEYFDSVSDCCYSCKILSYRHYRKEFGIQEECSVGYWPNATDNYKSCYLLEAHGLKITNVWIISAFVVTTIGIVISCFIVIFATRFSKRPVFKSCSMELAYVIWIGVAICHLNTFLVILPSPTYFSCSATRFTKTIGYTTFLSALFLKTHRIFRIFIGQFQKEEITLTMKWTSPRSQILMSLGLIMIQVFIVCVWMAIEPAEPISVYPGQRHLRICTSGSVAAFIAQLYNIMICVITTAYSYLSRNVPQKFNETRFINITMYSICISWAVRFISMSFLDELSSVVLAHKESIEPENNIGLSVIVTSISGTFVMVFMYTNKIYILLKDFKNGDRTDGTEIEFR